MQNQNLIPMVVEKSSSGERSWDIFSRLLEDRIIMLQGPVMEGTGAVISAQLLYLSNADEKKEIQMFINSPGGRVTEGLAIYDTMNFIKAPVSTTVMGQAASMGSFLASAGEPGKRFMLPSSRHMIHQVSSGTQGTLMDQRITLEESARLNTLLMEGYAKHTGHSVEKLEDDMSRDKFMSAQEAVDYNLADAVVTS